MIVRTGYNYGGSLLRHSLGLGSYFMLPDQGMKSYEVLSRGSLFFVKSRVDKKKYHLVSAAHIPYPFHFPKLYPPAKYPWLSFVTERDTIIKLQVREQGAGTILEEFLLERKVFKEEKRDLVVMHLEDEDHYLQTIRKKFKGLDVNPLQIVDDIIMGQEKVQIVGHDFTKNDQGEEVMVPVTLPGNINLFRQNRYFVQTPETAVMGLCGGPVLLQDGSSACIGMVEALVSPIQERPEAQGLGHILNNCVVIPSTDIARFIREVEKELESDVFKEIL